MPAVANWGMRAGGSGPGPTAPGEAGLVRVHGSSAAVAASGPILVVEDDPRVQWIIRETLEEEGLAVIAATDGWAALEIAARRRPALMILDWEVPRLNGDEVAAGMRAAFSTRVPILLISGDGHAAEHAWRIRAFSSLEKPFAMDELAVAVWIGLSDQ
jgi:DNA-binding response OmpR family regulator